MGAVKKILPFILFLIFSNVSYAEDLVSHFTASTDSLQLTHGKTQAVTFTISHDNSWCSVFCEYEIKNTNSQEILAKQSNIQITTNPRSYSFQYLFKAPSKEQGGISGQITYQIKYSCVDENTIFCGGNDGGVGSIFLSYDLTSEEKSAKTYLDSNLPTIKVNLEDSERKLYNIQTKINELPRNILVTDIKSDLNPHTENLNNYKNTYDQIKDSYDKLDFLSAQSLLTSDMPSRTSSLNSNIQDLDARLTQRIELHNQLANDIKKLNSDLNKLSEDSIFLGMVAEFDEVRISLEGLSNKFEGGLFQSYDEIITSISAISQQIANLSNDINEKKQSLIEDILKIMKSDEEKLCAEKKVCKKIEISNKEINDFCRTYLPNLKVTFDKSNKEEQEAYSLEVDSIRVKNNAIKEKNEKVASLNTLVEETYDLINKNSLEIDSRNCQNEFEKIKSQYALDNVSIDL